MNKYYVYALIDPRNDGVFYVGKGKNNRIDHHEKEAGKGVYSRKCATIKEIWQTGLEIKKKIIKQFFKEDEAYLFEKILIDLIGLERLTNVVAGGGGIPERQPKITITTKDYLNILLFRPCLTAKWLINGQKKVSVEWTGDVHTKIYAWTLKAFFNVSLPNALKGISKDQDVLNVFAQEMRNHGIEITYA